MDRQLKKYLWDILDCIEHIEKYVAATPSAELFSTNRLIVDAVERNFEIIGEAL